MLVYARHIDDLAPLFPMINRTVNKHVAFQIQPYHYLTAGRCLLTSIHNVLGKETITDEVLSAWAATYQQFAFL